VPVHQVTSSRTRAASVLQSAPLAVVMILACAASATSPAPALAQAVVTAVNGDPVTTFDVDEYTKILKLEHKAASRADALEAIVEDRLKYDEARHWGIDGSDADISTALAKVAAGAKTDPQAFSEAAAKNKIDLDSIRNHLRAIAAWDNLVRARNKGIGATDEEINAEIAKGHVDTVTNYRALRNRFDGCDTGLQLARSLPDVAIKEGTSRTSDALSAGLRKVLAATPRGMLTPPERSTNGVEMVAVCEKNDASDQTTLHDRVQKNLITAKLTSVSAKMYKDLRGTAVISKN